MDRLFIYRKLSAFRWNYLWLAVYFVGFGVYLIGMPKYIDDYWYLEYFGDWFSSQGISDPEWGGNFFKAGVPWREMMDTWEWHYENDTFRLGNILVVPFLLLPKWVGSSVAFGFWIFAVIGGLRLVGIDVKRSPLVPLALASYYVLMPWRYYMGSLDYQFNYMIPSGLLVWLLARLMSRKEATARRIFPTALLAFVLGWWHEGFGVPACCGVFVVYATDRFRNREALTALIGLAAGVALTLFSPGIRDRAQYANVVFDFTIFTVIDLLRSEWAFICGVFLLSAGLFIREYRRRLLGTPWIWILGAVCSASCGLWIYVQGGDRVGWACALLGVPWCFGIFKLYWPKVTGKYNVGSALFAAVIMGVVMTGLVMIDAETLRLRRQHSRVMAIVASNPVPQAIFEDYSYMSEKSPLMLGMPSWSFSGSGMRYLSNYFIKNKEGHRIYCVPRELEGVSATSGTPVPGPGGFRESGGKLYAPYDGPQEGQKMMLIELDFGKGYTKAFCVSGVFTSKADGKRYMFVDPDLGWYVTYFKRIRGVGRLYEP